MMFTFKDSLTQKRKQLKQGNSIVTPKLAEDLINEFRCSCERVAKGFIGGCYKKSFEYEDDYDNDNMKMVLVLARKKSYALTKDELELEALKVFRRHCTNLDDVINP